MEIGAMLDELTGAALSPPPPQAHWNLLMIGRTFSVRSCRFVSNFIFHKL